MLLLGGIGFCLFPLVLSVQYICSLLTTTGAEMYYTIFFAVFYLGVSILAYMFAIHPFFVIHILLFERGALTFEKMIWNHRRRVFRIPKYKLGSLEVDSGGFLVDPIPGKSNTKLGIGGINIISDHPQSDIDLITCLYNTYLAERDLKTVYAACVSDQHSSSVTGLPPEAVAAKKSRWTRLFHPPRLDIDTCLKQHLKFGLILLGIVVLSFISGIYDIQPDDTVTFFEGIFQSVTWFQFGLGIMLSSCGIFLRWKSCFAERLLTFQGIVFAILVMLYTEYMGRILLGGSLEGRVAHSPGILAYLSAYSARLVTDFSGFFDNVRFSAIRKFVLIAFGVGLLCDLVVVGLMVMRWV